MINLNTQISQFFERYNEAAELSQVELFHLNELIRDMSSCLKHLQKQPLGKTLEMERVTEKKSLTARLSEIENIRSRALKQKDGMILNYAKTFLGEFYDEGYFQKSFEELKRLGPLEDYADMMITYFKEKNIYIDKKSLSAALENSSSEKKEFVKHVLNDIFILTCQHVVQKPSENTNNFLKVISAFTFFEAGEYFSHLFFFEDYITQLDRDNYQKYSTAQKILALNSAKVVNSQDEKIYKQPFFIALLNYEKLTSLVSLEMKRGLPQSYLNTCVPASSNQGLLLKINSMPALLEVSRKMCREIRSELDKMSRYTAERPIFTNAFGIGGVKQKTHIEKQLKKSLEELDGAEKEMMRLLKGGKSISDMDISQFLHSWSRATQRLSAIYGPQKAYLTKKIFANHWMLSFLLFLIPCIIGSIFGNYPLFDQIGGFYTNPYPHTSLRPDLKPLTKTVYGFSSLLFLEWNSIFVEGGCLLLSQTHTVYVRAELIHGKKVFVVFDPKGDKSEIYSLEKFKSFVEKHY